MTCSITRTPTGEIAQVLNSEGVPSRLYNQIASLPFIMNGEEALAVYLQTESPKIQEKISALEGVETFNTGEPMYSFKVNDTIVDNYKDALTQSAGETITIGFQGTNEFVPLQEINTDLSPDTALGKINNLIIDGLLSSSRTKVENEMRLQGAGDNLISIINNNNEVLQRLNSSSPEYSIDVNNTLKLNGNKEVTSVDTSTFAGGTGESTQEFFGNVVQGGDARYEPSSSYVYEETFTGNKEEFRENYDSKKGNFDEHIATSIPTFRETQVKKGAAIVEMLKDVPNPVVYDLGGSEGSWIKTITEESGGNIKTINLDPSPDMMASFERNKPANSEMSLEAFYNGWEGVATHVPKEKADVVHESMMFQFIDNGGERMDYINEVSEKYLKEDGIFITEEKFQMNTTEEYRRNEKLKESHKNKYYTQEQQSLKADEILVGMKENQASYTQYISELNSKFKYVQPYWTSGNFRGIVATNSKERFDTFLKELGDTSNTYTFVPRLNSYASGEQLTEFSEKFKKELQDIKIKAVEDGTFLKSPSGFKSQLTEDEWLLTRHPNFINWFGDFINDPRKASKAVDAFGDPIVVYHGSNKTGFTEFSETDDYGYFFADDVSMANSYTSKNDYVDMSPVTTYNEVVSRMEEKGGEIQEVFEYEGNQYEDIEELYEYEPEATEDTIKTIYKIYEEGGSLLDEVDNKDDVVVTVNNTENLAPGVASYFLNIRDVFDINGNGENWDNITGVEKKELTLKLEYNDSTDQFEFTDFNGETTTYGTFIEAFEDIESLQPERADEIKEEYENGEGIVIYEGDPDTGEEAPFGQTTREWVREVVDNQDDGIIFRNITDTGQYGRGDVEATVFVVLKPENIKSTNNLGVFNPTSGDTRFSKSSEAGILNEAITPIIERLKQTGLAESVEVKNTTEISEMVGDNYKVDETVRGLVTGNKVILNSDSMTLDTPIHELGHLWNSYVKENNPELYAAGLAAVKKDGKAYIALVKKNQPKLKGEAQLEEALAQAIGDNGAKIIEKTNTGLKGWLENFWTYITDSLGIGGMTPGQFNNLTLDQFATAVAVDLLKGNTIAGLEQNQPGEGGQLTPKKLKQAIRREEVNIDISNYPEGVSVDLPRMTLEGIIKKYKGKIYITTSDATTIGLDDNVELIQGGPGYLTLKENVDNGIGFAALDRQGARSMANKVYKIGAGDPVAVLVMVQNPSSTLGNAYGGDFLYNAFQEIIKTQSKAEQKRFISNLELLTKDYFDTHVKDSTKKKFIASDHRDKVIKAVTNMGKGSIEDFHNVYVNDTNFHFRRNIMKDLVLTQNQNGKKPVLQALREQLKTVGFNYEKFVNIYVDKGVINDFILETDRLGTIIGGFEMKTDFKSSKLMSDYTDSVQDKGVKHKMFNGKMPSEGNFLTDVGYPVDANFTDYSKPNVNISKEFSSEADSLIPQWKPSVEEGVIYKDLKSKDSIDFKAYLATERPEMLYESVGTPSVDVARGIGYRAEDGSSKQMLEDFFGKQPEIPYTREDVTTTEDGKAFVEAMKAAVKNRPESGSQVQVLKMPEVKKLLKERGKLFITKDGMAGGYVRADGYMGGLFRNPRSTKTRAAAILQEMRVEAGGKFFDAFGETPSIHLESTYINNGFIPLVRMDFNAEFAPKNWEKTTLASEPENVFFVYAPGVPASIGDGLRNNNYEEAYEMAKNFDPETGVLEKRNPIQGTQLGDNLINDLELGGEISPIEC